MRRYDLTLYTIRTARQQRNVGSLRVSALYPTYYITYKPEAMAYACRTWGKAAGAESRTQGAIDASVDLSSANYNLLGESSGFGDEHSGQFNVRIQQLDHFMMSC